MKRAAVVREYFLQVVKAGEYPRWPRPEDELVINHRPLGSGFVQCWAYLKADNGDPREIPPAEILATRFPEGNPLIVIDQPGEALLELVLVKDRHAWAHTFSSPENLEDNLESIVDFAKKKFDIKVENYMTTGNVAPGIEDKLDQMEVDEKDGEENQKTEESHPLKDEEPLPLEDPQFEDQEWQTKKEPIYHNIVETEEQDTEEPKEPSDLADIPSSWEIKKVRTPDLNPFPGAGSFRRPEAPRIVSTRGSSFELNDRRGNGSSKLVVILPFLLLLAVFGGLITHREAVAGRVDKAILQITGRLTPTPTPTPTLAPTPTPTPTPVPADRKQYKLEVLNGTTKTGAAAALAGKLKDLGWQIAGTGNNPTRGIAQTIIKTKPTFEPAVATLISDLSGQYEATVSGTLKSTEKFDAEIVIGNK